MKLPNGDRAVVPIEKLRDYALNPAGRDGGAKARIFRAALGLTARDVQSLRTILEHHALSGDAVPGRIDEFGQRFIVDVAMAAFSGTIVLRSVWIVRTPGSPPLLVTYYPLRRKGGIHG